MAQVQAVDLVKEEWLHFVTFTLNKNILMATSIGFFVKNEGTVSFQRNYGAGPVGK